MGVHGEKAAIVGGGLLRREWRLIALRLVATAYFLIMLSI